MAIYYTYTSILSGFLALKFQELLSWCQLFENFLGTFKVGKGTDVTCQLSAIRVSKQSTFE